MKRWFAVLTEHDSPNFGFTVIADADTHAELTSKVAGGLASDGQYLAGGLTVLVNASVGAPTEAELIEQIKNTPLLHAVYRFGYECGYESVPEIERGERG